MHLPALVMDRDNGEGLFGKHYLGIIWEMARAAAILGRPGGTDFDLFKFWNLRNMEENSKNTKI